MKKKFKIGDVVTRHDLGIVQKTITGFEKFTNGWYLIFEGDTEPLCRGHQDYWELDKVETTAHDILMEEMQDAYDNRPDYQPKVDFTQLRATVRAIESKNTFPLSESELANLTLFFQMLGKSSSFAHLAHNRLKS